MSEHTPFKEPLILGISEMPHPFLDPATGEVGSSAFEPQPGEVVPPADVLAQVFVPRGQEQSVPEDIDAVRALQVSLQALSDRCPPRMQTRLSIYGYQLEKQEDKLDPPINRAVRAFTEEVTPQFEGMEDFDDLLARLFIKDSSKRPSAEDYQALGELFYDDSRAISLFYLFDGTAERQGLVSKNFEAGRRGRIYPVVNQKLRTQENKWPGSAADWFVDAIRGTEEVIGGLESGTYEDLADELEAGRTAAYSILSGLAWTLFVRKYPSKDYMHSNYDYVSLQGMLAKISAQLKGEYKPVAERFTLDVARLASKAMLKQKVITPQENGLLHATRRDREVRMIFERAVQEGDGFYMSYAEFDAELQEHLGVGINLTGRKFYELSTLMEQEVTAQGFGGLRQRPA